jgi:hypothetical protein
MFETKVVEKIRTHILVSINVFSGNRDLGHNVEKYDRARQVTHDNIIRRKKV